MLGLEISSEVYKRLLHFRTHTQGEREARLSVEREAEEREAEELREKTQSKELILHQCVAPTT